MPKPPPPPHRRKVPEGGPSGVIFILAVVAFAIIIAFALTNKSSSPEAPTAEATEQANYLNARIG